MKPTALRRCPLWICALVLGEFAGANGAEAPFASDPAAGVILHVAAAGTPVVEPMGLAANGQRLVMTLATSVKQRDAMRKQVNAAGLAGLVTVVEQSSLERLSLASWFVNQAIVEDWPGAQGRGLKWKELLRVAAPGGAVLVKDLTMAEATAQIKADDSADRVQRMERVDGWLRIEAAMPAGMSEWSHTRYADAGNREISVDRLCPRRNAHVNYHDYFTWEDDGPGSLEAAREPIWVRWLDGINHPGSNSNTRAMLAADGVMISVSASESVARVRDGALFNRGFAMTCRDAFNGALRWGRFDAGKHLAIGGGRLFSLNGNSVTAIDLNTGANLFEAALAERLPIHEMRATRDALVVAYGKGEVWGVAAFATATGKPCWRAPVHWTQVLVADNHVIVSCTDALVVPAKPHAPRLSVPPSAVVAFDLATGAQRWRLSCAELPAVESRRLHCAAEGVVVLWTDKELEILDLRTGKPRFRTAVELALKGPAYNRPLGPSVKDAWPLARGDAQRSAAASVQIAAELKPRWSARPQGVGDNATFTRRYVWRSNYLYSTTVTPPVVAANRVVYALPMEHCIVALDAGTGREAWRFEADGPVDSAPALVQGRAVFGCRDGAVYCLDLTDGALCWRRGLSPVSQRVNVYGQLENRYPVVGAVLPDNDGQVLATAGFNGQQRVIVARLHVGTGEVSEFRLLPRGSYPNDMLVADADGNVWLNYQPISPTTNCPATSRLGLDNFTRGHTLGRSTRDPKLLANLPAIVRYVPCYLLSADSELIATARTTSPLSEMRFGLGQMRYGAGRIAHTEMVYRGYPAILWTWDAEQMVGLQMKFFAQTGNDYPWGVAKELKKDWPVAKPGALFAVSRGKLDGGSIKESLLWQADLGEVWALAKAGDKVVSAGPVYIEAPPPPPTPQGATVFGGAPDKPIQADPLQTKGRLYLLSGTDGRRLATLDLPATPVQDGVAIAGGKVYLTCVDGSVVCLE